jgi:hypothetical protein
LGEKSANPENPDSDVVNGGDGSGNGDSSAGASGSAADPWLEDKSS